MIHVTCTYSIKVKIIGARHCASCANERKWFPVSLSFSFSTFRRLAVRLFFDDDATEDTDSSLGTDGKGTRLQIFRSGAAKVKKQKMEDVRSIDQGRKHQLNARGTTDDLRNEGFAHWTVTSKA